MPNAIDKNYSDRLTDNIYDQILTLVHERGVTRSEKLSALNLSELFGVSRTPVSFALYRLEVEGLIIGEDKGGWSITPVTMDDLNEIFAVKKILFPEIVSLAAKKMSANDDAKLFLLLDEIDRSLKFNDLRSWRSGDRGFNRLLSFSSGNKRLAYIDEKLNNQLYRIMISYLSLAWSDKGFVNYYSAISARVPSQAKSIAVSYISDLQKQLVRFLQDVILPLIGSDSLS